MAKLTPIRAIRAKCLDCACGQYSEVRECIINDCPLWEYRLGKRPAKSNSAAKSPKPDKEFSSSGSK